MTLKPTYELAKDPPEAMSWHAYETKVSAAWNELMLRDPAPSEKELQIFLEKHPALLPGAFNLIGGDSGHYPWYGAVVIQPILPSYNHRRPDFMWLSTNSDTNEPVLIEIESPEKPWFRGDGRPTAQLTEAMNQIAEWKSWLDVAANQIAFQQFYGLDHGLGSDRSFQPSFALIYGRRSEANARPELAKKRRHLSTANVVMMTYDRLRPKSSADQLVSIKAPAARQFTAVSVPPTLYWSPGMAKERAQLSGLDEAIDRCEWMDLERAKFLKERLPYWNEWARRDSGSMIRLGDRE